MDGAGQLHLLRTLQIFLQACRRLRTWRTADRLLALLSGITDPELRLHRLAEHLRARPPEEAAWTIARLWEQVAAGDQRAQAVYLGLLDLNGLARVLDADYLEAARAVLESAGDSETGLPGPPPRQPAETPDGRETEVAPRPKEPVGVRISQARRPIPTLIERLLFDPDVRVVRVLLGNPRLTETEVVKLAASRRATPEVLGAIAQDYRWISRYPVKVALANNPATPVQVILGLLPYLLSQDLRALATGSPSGAVRDRAAALLNRHPGV